MAELIPAPFADLVTRLYREPALQDALFELRRSRWYVPRADGPDMSVRFHGRPAGNPLGPAAGPHTQMAQNILLSYVAGGRILELKTVQVDDRLTIGRPCIDMTNVGYNIEWSQELRVEQSLREYVAGAMLVHMWRFAHPATADVPAWRGPAGEVIYDISVGYDLAGIRSDKVRCFLDGMRDAGPLISDLKSQISNLKSQIPNVPDHRLQFPDRNSAFRIPHSAFQNPCDLDFPTRLSDSITLSTFHGCPADEIERICEFLIGEQDFDVIVKMNPPMLGKERLEHLLHEVLGYRELTVNPEVYRTGLAFGEGVELCRRLTRFAAARGRRFGAKFSNTLEVLNHRDFFTADNKIMYLSGQPLYVITLALTDEFRRAMGAEFPISFSAGIDAQNFPHAVACGFTPITVSTDLLRPGGYGRMSGYLERLASEMRKCGAATIDEFILRCSPSAPTPSEREGRGEGQTSERVAQASLRNAAVAADLARNDPRYRAGANRKVPKRIDSTLETFDCITCDKCLPVCPNAANFTYPTPIVAFDYHDINVSPDGSWRPGQKRRFEITESMQIACYADFCNECGNCDTFCPEYGGPYIKKPSFFSSIESFERAAPRDGFLVGRADGRDWILGRIKGVLLRLEQERACGAFHWDDGVVAATFGAPSHELSSVSYKNGRPANHCLDMWAYHAMRHLLLGVLDASRINQVNAAYALGGDR